MKTRYTVALLLLLEKPYLWSLASAPWRNQGKIALRAAAVIATLCLFWPSIEHLWMSNKGVLLAIGGIIFLIACAFVYQGYDSLRSGITGAQPKASREYDDPNKASNRIAEIVWGMIVAFVGLFALWFSIRP
jgi:hypothetical protein